MSFTVNVDATKVCFKSTKYFFRDFSCEAAGEIRRGWAIRREMIRRDIGQIARRLEAGE